MDEAASWKQQLNNWRTAQQAGKPAAKARKAGGKLPAKLDCGLAQPFVPPGGTLWQSKTEGRVRAFWVEEGARPSTSAVLEFWGMHHAVVWCLQWLWGKYVESGGALHPPDGLMSLTMP